MFVYNPLRPIYLNKLKVSDLMRFYTHMELDEMQARWILLHHGKLWDTFDNIYLQQGFSALHGIVMGKYLTMQTIHAGYVGTIQCSREIYFKYMESYNTYESFRWFRQFSYSPWSTNVTCSTSDTCSTSGTRSRGSQDATIFLHHLTVIRVKCILQHLL